MSVNGKAAAPYLTVLVQSGSKNAVYGFLYPVSDVLEQFRIESMPEGTWFTLDHTDGTPLYSYGEVRDDGDYTQMTCLMPSLSCVATVGVPQTYFSRITGRAQTTAQTVFLISALLGLAMCFLFSHISVKPFRKLIEDHALERTQDAPDNELAAIDSYLKNTRERDRALRDMLLSSLLVRAFSGLAVSEDEYSRISAAYPVFQSALRAAVVRDRNASQASGEQDTMINLLRNALPEQFLCEYINIQESIVLFPADGPAFDLLQGVLLDLNRGSERNARFVCGVSTPFVGLNEVSVSIRQAQFCVPEDGERMLVQVMEENALTAPEAEVDLKQFQQAMSSWNQREALVQLDQMAAAVGKSGSVSPEELFYSVLYHLRDTAHSGKMSFEAYEKMTYQHTGSPASNLRRLKPIVNDLFEQKAAMQMSDKQLLCEEIVQHIRLNFSDSALCLTSVAKRFCVSERFVYNAVQDQTGMNVSTFLAQTRMQEAARLLRETDENVSTIAEKCGYTVESTFYRNFKKYHQVTPAEYKNALHEIPEHRKGTPQ